MATVAFLLTEGEDKTNNLLATSDPDPTSETPRQATMSPLMEGSRNLSRNSWLPNLRSGERNENKAMAKVNRCFKRFLTARILAVVYNPLSGFLCEGGKSYVGLSIIGNRRTSKNKHYNATSE